MRGSAGLFRYIHAAQDFLLQRYRWYEIGSLTKAFLYFTERPRILFGLKMDERSRKSTK